MMNFGMGSAMAATVMDLLSAVEPEAVLFLGNAASQENQGRRLHPADRGDPRRRDEQRILPTRDSGAPVISFASAVSAMTAKHQHDYWTGTVYTTNRRVWEHDEAFKDYLIKTRAIGIDMETATLFVVGFANHIPKGRAAPCLG